MFGVVRGAARRWSWEFFFLGAGFMLLETKSIIQFALLWGSTWVVASLTIASVLVMALVANWTVAHVEIRRPRLVGRGPARRCWRSTTSSRWARSRIGSRARRVAGVQRARLQPDLLRGAALRVEHQALEDVTVDYGANLLGAMVGGVAEYLSLLMGFQFLLISWPALLRGRAGDAEADAGARTVKMYRPP